jgi:hypothetical protein
MPTTIENLEKRVAKIESRNQSVEIDKAWEGSYARKSLIIIFTYFSVALYLRAIGVSNFWLHAIVPSLGFLLSTLSLPFFKNIWTTSYKKQKIG